MEALSTKAKIKNWLIILSAIPVFLIILVLLQLAFGAILALVTNHELLDIAALDRDYPMTWQLSEVTSQVLAVLAVVFIYWVKIYKNPFNTIGFQQTAATGKELLQGFLTGIFLIGIIFLALLYTNQIEVTGIQFSRQFFFFHILLYLLVGVNEELLFRGYLLGTTMKLANKYVVLCIFALLFSFVHFSTNDFSLFPITNIFLAGIILGQYYIHTKRLWYSISLHFTWNFFQGPVFGSNVSGNNNLQSIIQQNPIGKEWITGGSFGFEGSAIMTGLLILLIIYFEFYLRKNNKNVGQ
ncbi:CPBP family intramembrane glutamic endopeptidase [Maribellus sediminis]|uniref:CPBP family intramembrane glutamic endopeptidase n=1 Tax=Maribellus sediminis TaxID=2696285 RepID=UPI0014308F75|nr:CPBP family intramembrane glutamic endopeptidase [Maribellus sediminis]